MTGATGSARANIYDVARRAGVSHMTVSRVLNAHPNIRESTRERVNRAIDELQYQRSATARALATSRTMRLGAIVDNPVEWGPSSMLRSFEKAAADLGYSVGSFTTTDRPGRGIAEAVDTLMAQDIDGLCAIAPRRSSVLELQQQTLGRPSVLLVPEAVPGFSTVSVDQYAGGLQATQHLVELGHRVVAHVSGPLDWFDARDRARGWKDALAQVGLDQGAFAEGDWSSDFGYRWASEVELGECTAVFFGNDQMALGALHGFSSRGIRVPEDVSIVGFDDLPESKHYLPPLTTVGQEFRGIGELAVRRLVAAIDGDATESHELIAPKLVVRESAVSLPQTRR